MDLCQACYMVSVKAGSQKWIQFGWGTGAMTATLLEDYASPVNEEQVWSIYEGNARVKR